MKHDTKQMIFSKINNDNTEIEQKKFLKQNNKYKFPEQASSHELSKVFPEEFYQFSNNNIGWKIFQKIRSRDW